MRLLSSDTSLGNPMNVSFIKSYITSIKNLSTESNCPAGKAAHFACNAHCFHRSFSSDLFKQICKHGYEFAVRIKYFLSGCNTANF